MLLSCFTWTWNSLVTCLNMQHSAHFGEMQSQFTLYNFYISQLAFRSGFCLEAYMLETFAQTRRYPIPLALL
uniref:Secreted protein n=1 Tax=Kalanchoe fedtschenkoi TaxID=63787 RepID=A0A7N0USS5_KALFE